MSSGLPRLEDLARYFLRLGTVGFGGPAVLVERMRRDLQESRGWYTHDEYKEGLALAQLAPGPLAAQLAVYLGWARAGVRGATIVGIAFVLPSFVMVLAISALYLQYGGLAWMQAAFYGVGAAVIALIAESAWKLARRTVSADPLMWVIFIANAAVTAWTQREIVAVFVGSGVVAVLVRGMRGRWTRAPGTAAVIVPVWATTTVAGFWTSGLRGPEDLGLVVQLMWFFAKAGAVVFGSGLAIVPFLHGTVVQQHHWLTERQFLDAIAVSMITPGPVVITVAFIGYLVAGPLGATASAIGVFLPVYLIVVLVARWYNRFARNLTLRAAVDGVTAAATGAIMGAAVVLGMRAITDVATVVLFLATLAAVIFAKRIPQPALVLTAAVAGLLLHGVAG